MPFGTKASRKIFARETRDKITAKHFVFFWRALRAVNYLLRAPPLP
jgi:hypothetical protein